MRENTPEICIAGIKRVEGFKQELLSRQVFRPERGEVKSCKRLQMIKERIKRQPVYLLYYIDISNFHTLNNSF